MPCLHFPIYILFIFVLLNLYMTWKNSVDKTWTCQASRINLGQYVSIKGNLLWCSFVENNTVLPVCLPEGQGLEYQTA